jgi:hypothetical protein
VAGERHHWGNHRKHHEESGQETQGASTIEVAEANRTVFTPVAQEQRGDQEAREDEEQGDADLSAVRESRQLEVLAHDQEDRDSSQAIEGRPMPGAVYCSNDLVTSESRFR